MIGTLFLIRLFSFVSLESFSIRSLNNSLVMDVDGINMPLKCNEEENRVFRSSYLDIWATLHGCRVTVFHVVFNNNLRWFRFASFHSSVNFERVGYDANDTQVLFNAEIDDGSVLCNEWMFANNVSEATRDFLHLKRFSRGLRVEFFNVKLSLLHAPASLDVELVVDARETQTNTRPTTPHGQPKCSDITMWTSCGYWLAENKTSARYAVWHGDASMSEKSTPTKKVRCPSFANVSRSVYFFGDSQTQLLAVYVNKLLNLSFVSHGERCGLRQYYRNLNKDVELPLVSVERNKSKSTSTPCLSMGPCDLGLEDADCNDCWCPPFLYKNESVQFEYIPVDFALDTSIDFPPIYNTTQQFILDMHVDASLKRFHDAFHQRARAFMFVNSGLHDLAYATEIYYADNLRGYLERFARLRQRYPFVSMYYLLTTTIDEMKVPEKFSIRTSQKRIRSLNVIATALCRELNITVVNLAAMTNTPKSLALHRDSVHLRERDDIYYKEAAELILQLCV
jgi:hypothetical protein